MKLFTRIIFVFLFLLSKTGFSQSHYQLEWQYHYTGFVSPMSLDADTQGKPYVYVASNEEGLKILRLNGTLSSVMDTNVLQMSVQNFTQVGNLLYIALGRQAKNNHDPPGLAIVDVSNPAAPVVKDIWIHPVVPVSNGSGIVRVEGNYAYLGAMGLGLVILNISDPTDIQFVSELKLNINYPVSSPAPNPDLYNARGMEVKNSIVYLCFDAGGLRIVNCTNKLAPKETGHYANPITYIPMNKPRAYNNIILNDTVAYVAVDYCGLEVLRISDTAHIILLDNFNPVNCPTGSWNNAAVHANELKYNDNCKEVFMSTGKSEMISMDVSNPSNIDSTGMYGSLSDTTATWGIGMRNDSIYLSYIYIPIYISWLHPFDAKWAGVKMIKWSNPCSAGISENEKNNLYLRVQPNPFDEQIRVFLSIESPSAVEIRITDMMGRTVMERKEQFVSGENEFVWNGVDLSGNAVSAGMYFLTIENDGRLISTKLLKSK